MHSKYYRLAVVLILTLISITILPVSAYEVEVNYVPQDNELKTFHMEVRVQGEGTLIDQGVALKNPTIYTLHYDESKHFILKPAYGYEIATIQYDGEDITNLLQQQAFTVKGKDHDTKLIVTFCKQSSYVQKDTDTTNTGDTTNTVNYLSIILLSTGFIIFINKKRGHQYDER